MLQGLCTGHSLTQVKASVQRSYFTVSKSAITEPHWSGNAFGNLSESISKQ